MRNLRDDLAAAALGERLLESAFPSAKLGRGFYCHLEAAPDFAPVPVGSKLHNRLLSTLGLSAAIVDGHQMFGFDEYGEVGNFTDVEVTVVTNGNLVVGGFYDGDGHVIAADLEHGQWVENTDMKCHDYWHFIESPSESAMPTDATESAVATAKARAERRTLLLLSRSFRGMPDPNASCTTCMDGAIAVFPHCGTCKRTPV
jgi:hypothetical protein